MPRLPHPTAIFIPGLMRRAVFEVSHCCRTAAAASATIGCGAVWRTSCTRGRFTVNLKEKSEEYSPQRARRAQKENRVEFKASSENLFFLCALRALCGEYSSLLLQ